MKKLLFTMLMGMAGWVATVSAAPANSIEGTWSGTLSLGSPLTVVFHISPTASGWKATMDSPNQGVQALAVNEVDWKGTKVTLISAAINGQFDGSLNPAGDRMTGTWIQGPYSLPLVLQRISEVPPGPHRNAR